LVLTLAIGFEAQQLYSLSSNSIQAYAQKIGADFADINQHQLSDRLIPPHYNKLIIGDYLEIYDRILYVDCDLIISATTPNIFDFVPDSAIGVVNESEFSDRTSYINAVKQDLGDIPAWQTDYFNTGVMVISKTHRQLFTHPTKFFIDIFYEQTYFNWQARKLGYEICYIDPKFNWTQCQQGDLPLYNSAYITHFAGWGFQLPTHQVSDKHTCKYHQMKCFLDYLEGIKSLRIHPEHLSLGSGYLSSVRGLKQLISSEGNQDLVSYGPYLAIANGLYKAIIDFEVIDRISSQIASQQVFSFDVVSMSGNQVWYSQDVFSEMVTSSNQFEFQIICKDIKDLEIRFFARSISFAINFIELILIE
jgi:hypothetical protein